MSVVSEYAELNTMEHINTTLTVQRFLADFDTPRISLSPSFQREFVWGKDLQRGLIFSIFKGNPIGIIKLWRKDGKKYNTKVVDGKQRLITLKKFCDNEFFLDSDRTMEIIEEYTDQGRLEELINADLDDVDSKEEKEELKEAKKKAKQLKKKTKQKRPRLKFKNLLPEMKKQLLYYEIPGIAITDATEKQVRSYFTRVQHQEKLKAGEIINAINSIVLEEFISKIDDIQSLKKNLRFTKKRREFEKIYFNIIGILESELNLGTTDKKVINYAEKCNMREEEIKNNEKLIGHIESLNKNLNEINQLDLNIDFNLGKSDLKFLLFLCAYDFMGLKDKYDLKDIIENFYNVALRFKAFYSANRTEALEKYFPDFNFDKDEDEKLLKKYESIAALRKGNHRKDRVLNQMKSFAELIEKNID